LNSKLHAAFVLDLNDKIKPQALPITYMCAARMLLNINGEFTMGKWKSSHLS
jgi:hypothetical protein